MVFVNYLNTSVYGVVRFFPRDNLRLDTIQYNIRDVSDSGRTDGLKQQVLLNGVRPKETRSMYNLRDRMIIMNKMYTGAKPVMVSSARPCTRRSLSWS